MTQCQSKLLELALVVAGVILLFRFAHYAVAIGDALSHLILRAAV